VKGCNDSAEELVKLKKIIDSIHADGILINTLDRPGTESGIEPVGSNRLKDISEFLEGAEIVIYKTVQPETAKRYED
jgi:wyosine [tRNA(Phe)-imidazoG37] synthetase (radical SAM superfamily)